MKQGNTLLIVDHIEVDRMIVRDALSGDFERILEATNGEEAYEIILEQRDTIDLVLLDVSMPAHDGLELLGRLRKRGIEIPVVACSSNDRIRSAVEAMRLGAKDCIEKPIEPELLRIRAKAVLSEHDLQTENLSLRNRLSAYSTAFSLVGSSKALSHVLFTVAKVSRLDCAVLVQGESGTGKDVIARAIHYLGPRATEPFQPIDCGNIPPALLESELFGHEKDVFSGAQGRRSGLLQAAGQGTVFLDEIGELPKNIQSRLLQVLLERQIRPVGGVSCTPFKARLVAATNRDLKAEAKAGRFIGELFLHLNIVEITAPPLRDRKEDIPALVEYFLTKHTIEGKTPHTVSLDTMKVLMEHSWPGNIRELENSIERAIGTARNIELNAMDILTPSTFDAAPDTLTESGRKQVRSLGEFERQAVIRAIEACGGDRQMAATLLGINEAMLQRKLMEPDPA